MQGGTPAIVPVHGHGKQGSGYGYTGVQGLNALIATATATYDRRAPVIVGQRLRRGGCGSPRGAARMVTDAVSAVRRLHPRTPGGVLVRADSAFYGHKMVSAAIRAGVDVSVTVRMTAKVKAAIAAIDETA